MKKFFSVFLVFCLMLPTVTTNGNVTLSAKHYSSSSSSARSRNNSSLNKLNKQNNYSSSNSYSSTTKKSSSPKTRSRTKVFGGVLGAMFVGSLLFGNNILLSTLTTIVFWVFIFSLLMRLLRPKRNSQTYEKSSQMNNQYESHHMQQMRYINELVDMANAKDIDVSYILDDENLSLDEKIKLIRERVS